MNLQLEKLHLGYRETNDRLENEAHERRLTEKELRVNQERLRALTSEMVMTEERERRHIAAELHDRIGQALAVLRIHVEVLLKEVPVDPENTGKVKDLIEDIIQESRTLIFEISPPVLYELGLGAALEWLADEMMEHHDIRIETEDRLKATIDDSIRALIFRSVRELLHNILKHAEADRAWIRLEQAEDDLRIVVEDNGVGFTPDESRQGEKISNGFGLFSIQERFRQLGGQISITTGARGGALITLCMPLATARKNFLDNPVEGS
jgi:signal transduction histidine kinase